MNRRHVERGLWTVTVLVFVLICREVILANRNDVLATGINGRVLGSGAIPKMAAFDSDSLDSATTHTVTHDPFRVDRKPAMIAFSMAPSGVAGPPVPPAPIVRIVLHGTIGGPPWHAIISGIPGRDGTIVVSSGDTLGTVAIRSVNRDGVTVRVRDSTWTVTLAKAGA
jgi:hypothetical protein